MPMDWSERGEMIDALKFAFLAFRLRATNRFEREALESVRSALVRAGETTWLEGM